MVNKAKPTAKQIIAQMSPPSEEEIQRRIAPIVQRKLDFYHQTFPEQERLLDDKYLRDVLEHFEDHGWAIAPKLIPDPLCDNLVDEMNKVLTEQSGFNINAPSTWDNFPFRPNGFVELYHLKTQYQIRFNKGLYQLFSTLYSDEKLRIIIDRNCCKRSCYRPASDQQYIEFKQGKQHHVNTDLVPSWDWSGFWHHDMNIINGYAPTPIQCVISLDETDETTGGFQCLDRFHWYASEYGKLNESYCKRMSQPNYKLPVFIPNEEEWIKKCGVHPAMKKGDVMVWKAETCHGGGSNKNKNGVLRLATYVNFVPANHERPDQRSDHLKSYQTGCPPSYLGNDAKYSAYEKDNHTPYPLESEFEERLIGVSEY